MNSLTVVSNNRYQFLDQGSIPSDISKMVPGLIEHPEVIGILVLQDGSKRRIKAISNTISDDIIQVLINKDIGPKTLSITVSREAIHLIADGVLKVKCGERYHTGIGVFRQELCETLGLNSFAPKTDELSRAAIRHAFSYKSDDVQLLMTRLYFYNRLPRKNAVIWAAEDKNFLAAFLNLDFDTQRMGDSIWSRVSSKGLREDWLEFKNLNSSPLANNKQIYKLYFGVEETDLSAAIEYFLEVSKKYSCAQFKVPMRLQDHSRPDKFVSYFTDYRSLERFSCAWLRTAGPLRIQQVPFTTKLDEPGTLSYAFDPPRSSRVYSWEPPTSWRVWISTQIAFAVGASKEMGFDITQTENVVLNYLGAIGVNTSNWETSEWFAW